MSDTPKIYPLSGITRAIERVIDKYASKYFWVKAEIVKLNHYKQSGHCYPDLVEKVDGKIVAEIRGIIWRDDFIRINNRFKKVLNEELGDDMTVVCYARVKYSPVHGLSLIITDINPEYTLGELARQKSETIERLKSEGIYFKNKQLPMPPVPKIIAVISVESSKGYRDFISVIDKNPWGYKFQYKLFPALLQGARSVSTITAQLEHIKKYKDVFDVVTIIRGGGGDIGLSSYDTYELSKAVATFPIPVLSGIGHATNQTVTEMVSHANFITPTKIAEFLIQQYHNFSVPLKEHTVTIRNFTGHLFEISRKSISDTARLFNSLTLMFLNDQKFRIVDFSRTITAGAERTLSVEKSLLQDTSRKLIHLSDRKLNDEKGALIDKNKSLRIYSVNFIEKEKDRLKSIEREVRILSPVNILKRGFSITRLNGKAVNTVKILKKDDVITTVFTDGITESIIQKTKQNE